MNSRTQERVEQWDSRSFSGGSEALSDLAAAEFSGAVTAAGTWLFMLNGRVVGVFDGDIEDFEHASGTRYDAPHPSLPLLCSMKERGGDTRANYYTNETPLREVDTTLQEGSFTGYIELSENVLSGDYYAVYYGGRRMAAAYIGSAERLCTGDEAFDRADDEVGIYDVIDVDIDVTDVPGANAGVSEDTTSSTDPSANAPTSATETTAADTPSTVDGSTADDSSLDSTATDASPTADETTSTLDSLEFAGIDGTTDDEESTPRPSEIDLMDDATGITTTDDQETEPTAAGITGPADADPVDEIEPLGSEETADVPPEADVTSERDRGGDGAGSAVSDEEPGADVAGTELDSGETAGPDVDSVVDGPELESDSAADPTESEAGDSDRSAATSTSTPDGETNQSDASPPVSEDASNEPDLAELEAAAKALDRNDISWVEDQYEESKAGAGDGDSAAGEGEAVEERFQEEEQWREARSIPSIDPDNSEIPEPAGGATHPETAERSGSAESGIQSAENASPPATRHRSEQGTTQPERRQQSRSNGQAVKSQSNGQAVEEIRSKARARIQELTERIEQIEEQRDALREHSADLEDERDQLRSKNQELTATVERLQGRIDDLETELERARNGGGEPAAASPSGTELDPDRALSETNLFVRYRSKSQPTLQTAHDGDADREGVAENLQLEHHTQFDESGVVVEGTSYEAYLESTMAYRFVDWLTEMVLYEIRDTGNADGLGDLYDAIPRIDRAELNATISLADDDTDDVPDQVSFDVVAYDKMGNPLVVANLNDSRSPATEGMLAEMEEAASAVKANYPELAAATVVTSSYFEPGALEVAEQATSSSLLSRGSKLSYVNLSRKSGYHLCLVESRSEGFHMNVPEL